MKGLARNAETVGGVLAVAVASGQGFQDEMLLDGLGDEFDFVGERKVGRVDDGAQFGGHDAVGHGRGRRSFGRAVNSGDGGEAVFCVAGDRSGRPVRGERVDVLPVGGRGLRGGAVDRCNGGEDLLRIVGAKDRFARRGGRAGDDVVGEHLDADDRGVSKEDSPLDDIFEFADIAGPAVGFHACQRFGGEGADISVEFGVGTVDEVLRQQNEVGAAGAQGRQHDGVYVEPVEEV